MLEGGQEEAFETGSKPRLSFYSRRAFTLTRSADRWSRSGVERLTAQAAKLH
jgi:hypothetical protein